MGAPVEKQANNTHRKKGRPPDWLALSEYSLASQSEPKYSLASKSECVPQS